MEIQRELDDYEKERTMLEEQEEKAEGDYARMAELKSKELQLNTGAEQSCWKRAIPSSHGESGPCHRAVDQDPRPRSGSRSSSA